MNEERIVWLEEPAKYPYVRETRIELPGRSRKPAKWRLPERTIGFATLTQDAASTHPGQFLRRVWYVASHDPYPGGPAEAVDPTTVRINKPSTRHVEHPREWAEIQEDYR